MLSTKAFFANFTALLILTATLFSGFTLPTQTDFVPDIPLVSLEFPEQKDFTLSFQAETLDANVRLIWPASAASIPSGWSRDTQFDDRFLQGSDDNYLIPIETIAPTHFHNNPAHSHAADGHDHEVSGQSVAAVGAIQQSVPPAPNFLPAQTHGHMPVTSSSATIDYDTNSSDTNSLAAIPKHVTGIIIKPDDGLQSFPSGAMAFLNDTTIPTGFNVSDGNNSTVDVTGGRFILGADTGNDGGTFGGSDSSLHELEQHSHDEEFPHIHPIFQSAGTTTSVSVAAQTMAVGRPSVHHMLTLDVNSVVVTDENASVMVDDINNSPDFISFLAVQASSDLSAFDEIIVPFVGQADMIPSGWTQVQDFNRQIKAIVNPSDINVTGGGNLHDHEIPTHTHTFTIGHSHDVNNDADFGSGLGRSGFPAVFAVSTANHDHVWDVDLTIPTIQGSGANLQPADKRYSRVTVIFIRKLPAAPVDTCTYDGSGDWVVDCQDACLIVSDVDLIGNSLVFINSGSFDLNAVLRRISSIQFPATPDICVMRVYILEKGGFELE